MQKKYRIEVNLYPHNKLNTFFWVLFSNTGKEWCNEASGWASSPQKAWADAYQLFLHIKNNDM